MAGPRTFQATGSSSPAGKACVILCELSDSPVRADERRVTEWSIRLASAAGMLNASCTAVWLSVEDKGVQLPHNKTATTACCEHAHLLIPTKTHGIVVYVPRK
jgi:hypothetical protein